MLVAYAAAIAAATEWATINGTTIGNEVGPGAATHAAIESANATAWILGLNYSDVTVQANLSAIHAAENAVIDRIANLTDAIKNTQDIVLTGNDFDEFMLRTTILEHEINRIRVHEGLAPRVSAQATRAELARRAEIRYLQERLANLSMQAQVYLWPTAEEVDTLALPQYDPSLIIRYGPHGPLGRLRTLPRAGTVPPDLSYHHNPALRASEASPNSAHLHGPPTRDHGNQGHVQVGGDSLLEVPIMIKRQDQTNGLPATAQNGNKPSVFAKYGPRKEVPSWITQQNQFVSPTLQHHSPLQR